MVQGNPAPVGVIQDNPAPVDVVQYNPGQGGAYLRNPVPTLIGANQS